MSRPHLRPRFAQIISAPPETVLEHLRPIVGEGEGKRGWVSKGHLQLSVPKDEQHTWSPTLDVEVREHPEGSRVSARFAPRPDVWTFYVFAYAGLACGGMAALMYGWVQLMLDEEPHCWWAIVVGGLAALAVHGSALFGRRLGAPQMEALTDELERALGDLPHHAG